ncbi:DUF4407 domain-containing protein [Micromonospora sp. WMMD712]|uniref:DUF4407 domain-containing protein n=1 Tax=Micromonospora sp. WMMD712 TaxID=3016096 RepID=UPI00249A57C4|nr:DUF4407 domain-containing protein [Micromonospora sp. WMMD712]WFE58615.1 DUF4407 domain-containing protein [Micromonospora sp. WMMD712]
MAERLDRNFGWPIGSYLRALAGVQEEVLNFVPNERPRYTALGGVVVGASLLAVVSMFAAMRWVTDSWVVALVVSMFWGAMILTLDRWLVTSVSGSTSRAGRLGSYVPRILMAALMGVVIAEPLVLTIFQREVEQEVSLDRMRSLQEYESKLRLCNPVAGTSEAARQPDPAACQGYLLVVPDPGAALVALAGYQAQADEMQKSVDAGAKELDQIETRAWQECNGEQGAGLSGSPGEGPNCKRLRADADRLRAEQTKKAARLSDLRELIRDRQASLSEVQESAAQERNAAIRRLVRSQEAALGPIGLIDRLSALQRLGSESSSVAAAAWLLRLLIMLIDVLPAFVRLVMGTTDYDRIVAYRSELAVQTQFAVAENHRDLVLADEELARERKELELAVLRERIELDASIDRLLVDSHRASLISRRATELRSASKSISAADLPEKRDHPSVEP